MWGMMSAAGFCPLIRLQGIPNAEVYKQIIQQYAIPQLQSSPYQPPTFMHDNAPCHISKKIKSFLFDNRVPVMDWTAESPDLNPIENIGILLVIGREQKIPKNKKKFFVSLKTEWNKIIPLLCKKMIDFCGKRCRKVIDSKWKNTKYWQQFLVVSQRFMLCCFSSGLNIWTFVISGICHEL